MSAAMYSALTIPSKSYYDNNKQLKKKKKPKSFITIFHGIYVSDTLFYTEYVTSIILVGLFIQVKCQTDNS